MGILVFRDSDQGKRLVGRIDYEIEQSATFSYDEHYVKKAQAASELGISERLPLDDRPYESEEIAPFFKGLLPEGDVLDELSRMYQIPKSDYLSLIEQLGRESIGALTFVSDGFDIGEYDAECSPLGKGTVKELSSFPVRAAAIAASETRLSLSGAQSKVAWLLPEGVDARTVSPESWRVPKGAASSTHIVKLSRKGEEDIAVNELACSMLADACGIETAPVTLLAGIPGAIAVERYDRIWIDEDGDRRILRLHQEDFCQAMGLSPYFKYQPESTECSYLCMIADLLDAASDNPLADKREFAKRLVFNFIVGNSDAHLKNSALLYDRTWTGRKLAPLYDVTCIPLTGYSTKMAFDIGVHRELREIDERDLLSIPLDLDIPLDVFDNAVSEVIHALEALAIEVAEGPVGPMIERILENARPRLTVVKRLLDR